MLFTLPFLLAIASGLAVAQYGRRWRPRPGALIEDRNGVEKWKVDERFKHDVFTFVRVEYSSGGGVMYQYQMYPYQGGGRRGWRRGWGAGWETDWPDSDLNFSLRLKELTSLTVNPDPIHLPLTDPRLFDYPFLYMIEPGSLLFSEEEVAALRHYLENGGFLMVDDFWGDSEWENFEREIKRVFPAREIEELSIEHEIFHCVYPLKEKPQVPAIEIAQRGRSRGITWEPYHDGDTRTVHFRAIFDDQRRMMVIICHNTDLGDGWEREAEDPWFFEEFSKKKAYPMGINIVTYAMTH
jgi:hypothetical protein